MLSDKLHDMAERIRALEAQDVISRPAPSSAADVWLGLILVIALELLLALFLVGSRQYA